MASAFRLPITVLDLVGVDAAAILHNLTTNDVRSLGEGASCETFLTDVRGKTLAHVHAFRTGEGYRLIGAAGQAEAITAHADRYTIREDATPVDRSAERHAVAIVPDARNTVSDGILEAAEFFCDVPWLGERSLLLVFTEASGLEEALGGIDLGDEVAFHHARTVAGFPWYGVDVSDKNLPQEASRIEQSICFTKGCYLGQETVARLDALGQVQKQLVRWTTRGVVPTAGSEVTADDKVVGRLTSVAATGEDTAIAIGIARRSHFDPGSTAQGDGFEATVG